MVEPINETQRTLWIGDLGYWMDENFIFNLFAATGTVTSVKIIRSKATNVSEGYGFIEFNSHEAASQVLFEKLPLVVFACNLLFEPCITSIPCLMCHFMSVRRY